MSVEKASGYIPVMILTKPTLIYLAHDLIFPRKLEKGSARDLTVQTLNTKEFMLRLLLLCSRGLVSGKLDIKLVKECGKVDPTMVFDGNLNVLAKDTSTGLGSGLGSMITNRQSCDGRYSGVLDSTK